MFKNYDFLQLQTDDDIESLYSVLNEHLNENNKFYFHFDNDQLHEFIKNPKIKSNTRFKQFKQNWENFNTHKQLLYHFFHHNTVNYPKIFKNNNRILIKEITINYKEILNEINILRINKCEISYAYTQLILKLVRSIIIKKVLEKNQNIITCEIDLYNNKILVEYFDIDRNSNYNKEYKLTKFLLKYQSLYPEEFEHLNAWLIISADWKDIFLSSTFKQWVSCMNLINTYKDHKIKYSNENYVKSGRISCVFGFEFE